MARSKEFDEREVLKKAMELFWKQGYEKTSMQDLVTYTGIHRRSMYDTFGDKHSLFMKVLDHYGTLMEDNIKKQVLPLSSVKQSIRRIFEMAISRKEQQSIGCLTVNTVVELSLHDEEVAEKVHDSFSRTEQFLYELLLHGQGSGEVPKQYDAKSLAEFLHNSLVGIRVLTKTTDDRDKLERIIDTTLSVLN